MIAIALHKAKENAITSGAKLFDIGSGIVAIDCAKPYGFCIESDKFLYAGESLTSQRQSNIDSIVSSDQTGKSIRLGYGLYLLVIVDKITGEMTIHNSVSSSRPYYLYQDDQKIIVSSSIRKLRSFGVALEFNEAALPELLVYRFVTPPNSILSNVERIPGGESRSYSSDLKLKYRHPYDFATTRTTSSDIVSRVEQSLSENIAASLSAFNKPAMLLSGGLDSSLLGVLAVKNGSQLDSVSSGFGFINKDDGESEYARTVAEHLSVKHDVVDSNKEQYLTDLVDSIYFTEEPVHHLQSVMLYRVFKERATLGNDLFLCGEAADGLFGNESHQRTYKFSALNFILSIPPLRQLLKLGISTSLLTPRFHFFGHNFSDDLVRPDHLLHSLGQFVSPKLVKNFFGFNDEEITRSHRQLTSDFSNHALLDQISIVSLLCEGAVTMSVWSKIAESAGVAIAYPFAAENMIQLIYGVDWESKLREPKYYVRETLRKSNFPEQFILRPKRSFGLPIQHWALPGKMFQPLVDIASSSFDAGMLRELQEVDFGKAMLLWNLINIYLFKKLIIEQIDRAELTKEIIDRHRQLAGKK